MPAFDSQCRGLCIPLAKKWIICVFSTFQSSLESLAAPVEHATKPLGMCRRSSMVGCCKSTLIPGTSRTHKVKAKFWFRPDGHLRRTYRSSHPLLLISVLQPLNARLLAIIPIRLSVLQSGIRRVHATKQGNGTLTGRYTCPTTTTAHPLELVT